MTIRKQKLKCHKKNLAKWKFSVYMSKPSNFFDPANTAKTDQLGLKSIKKPGKSQKSRRQKTKIFCKMEVISL